MGATAMAVVRPRPVRRPAARAQYILLGLWACVLGYMLLGEWRLASGAGTPHGTTFRVLFWNSEVDRLERFEERVLSEHPDIAIIANAPHRADWQFLRAGFGGPTATTRSARFSIVSRYPVLRWGVTDLKIKGSRPRVAVWPGGGNIGIDSGEAMYAELDTSAITGCTTMVWALDLPSDPRMDRADMMHQARATLDAFTGPAYRRTDDGLEQPDPAVKGFPAPDLIVGDFNTPRGSGSLKIIAGTMRHAFDDAGHGFAATWPRKAPAIAIDQAFLGDHLEAVRYRVVDLGAAQHSAEVIDLAGVMSR
jgi:hypothetical protein